jgi:hypothetical protein
MRLVKGSPEDTERNPAGRIRHTRRLLVSAALIMSVFLIASSLVTTLLACGLSSGERDIGGWPGQRTGSGLSCAPLPW